MKIALFQVLCLNHIIQSRIREFLSCGRFPNSNWETVAVVSFSGYLFKDVIVASIFFISLYITDMQNGVIDIRILFSVMDLSQVDEEFKIVFSIFNLIHVDDQYMKKLLEDDKVLSKKEMEKDKSGRAIYPFVDNCM